MAGTGVRENGKQRRLIMEKSQVLFWEKGYAETSMKDIANECGFRPANIYNFFASKEEILFSILKEEMEEIVNPIRFLEYEENDPLQQLRFLIEIHVKITLGEKRASKLLFDTELRNLSAERRKVILDLRDDYNRIGYAILKRGIHKGLFKAMDEKIALNLIASMIVRTRLWFSPEDWMTIEDLIEFIFQFALKGLSR
ncbi:MAG: TetR family transcriptional regulator [Spirochaetes bacterium]|jgi:AcrR family transcriptional regulator|nr:TetR family transcriptional regulator [Spirochaetota bacterium]